MTNITMLAANRTRLLRQALRSIGDLSDATVTVRDANMNSSVDRIVSEWCERDTQRRVRVGFLEEVGTGPARNQVIECSEEEFGRGGYLYLSDDDVFFLRPDWLSILLKAYDEAWNHGFRVIGAYNHPFHQPISTLALRDDLCGAVEPGNSISYCKGNVIHEVNALALQSMLMRWEVWDQYGPFCQTPPGKVCQSEDIDFTNKIHADGGRIGVIAPPLVVNCGITNSFGNKIPGWEAVRAEAPQGVLVE